MKRERVAAKEEEDESEGASEQTVTQYRSDAVQNNGTLAPSGPAGVSVSHVHLTRNTVDKTLFICCGSESQTSQTLLIYACLALI